jgi:hypothetical protein
LTRFEKQRLTIRRVIAVNSRAREGGKALIPFAGTELREEVLSLVSNHAAIQEVRNAFGL